MSTLYENIKELCEAKGISGGKMCLEIGISKSTLTSLKNGRTKAIKTENIQTPSQSELRLFGTALFG